MQQPQTFPCDSCGKTFTNMTRLKVTAPLDTGEEKKFECKECRKKCKWHGPQPSQKLMSFTNEANKANIEEFECEICMKRFRKKVDLRSHMVTHSDARPYKCKECMKTFKRKSNLRAHKVTHNPDLYPQCDVCGKRFTSRACFSQHKYLHTPNKSFECEVCKKRFTLKKALRDHFLNHTNVRKFECDSCKKKFKTKSALRHHLRKYVCKEYECDECGGCFYSMTQLKRHRNLIHNGNSVLLNCNECGRQFIRKCDIVHHLKVHFRKDK